MGTSQRCSKLSGHGCLALWGVTPAIDIVETAERTLGELKPSTSSTDENDTLNILIFSAADARHIIKTIAEERARASRKAIKFYVLNSALENVARDLLFLSIVWESPDLLGLQSKSEFFLELFGNLRIRESTKLFLKQKCAELIRLTANDGAHRAAMKLFDLSQLRSKDRDNLETIFKMWMTEDKELDLMKCWDARMRRDLEGRYDARVGAFDWDYTMNLCEIGAEMITAPAYYQWRESGVAFNTRDILSYTQSNNTLVSGLSVARKHTCQELLGYWGDMLTSPYVSFGLGQDALKYRELRNKVHTAPSSEISQKVLMDYCRMIFSGNRSKEDEQTDVETGATITELFDGEEAVSKGTTGLDEEWQHRYNVTFLPPVQYSMISGREKYQKLFDIVYIGGHSNLDSISDLSKTLRPNAVLIFESPKYLIGLPKTRCTDYHRTLKEKFAQNTFDVSQKYDPGKDDFFCFVHHAKRFFPNLESS